MPSNAKVYMTAIIDGDCANPMVCFEPEVLKSGVRRKCAPRNGEGMSVLPKSVLGPSHPKLASEISFCKDDFKDEQQFFMKILVYTA